MEQLTSEIIRKRLLESRDVITHIYENKSMIETIESVAKICIERIRIGGKILFMGNGGSASDAQHLATELVSRYLKERPAIAALALTTDTSSLTAISNDYSFDRVFSRQIEALASENDVVFGISTSGNSENVILGVEAAKAIGCHTIGLTGASGGELAQLVDTFLGVPCDSVPIIQQLHITIGHIICELIEEELS